MGSRTVSVSLCMIVRNEEHNLAACLEPVAELFDEIVIVDTGSQDDTKAIARRFTPQVFDFEWCDDFSAARNESLRRASGEWIFWLDADDRLSGANVAKLRLLLDSLGSQPRAYLMDTACTSSFECEGVRMITHPRLFRRHAELRWRGRVHEQLRPDLAALGFEVVLSDIQIDHVGYQDAALRQRKMQRDVRLLRMDFAVDPDDPSTLVHLGLTYARLGKNDEARKYLLRLLGAQRGPSEWMRQVYSVLADLALREGQLENAIQVAESGLSLFPDDEHLLLLKAEGLYELDAYDAARDTLVRIINAPPSRQYRAGAPGDIQRKLAPRRLGDVLRLQGAYQEAEATLLQVVGTFPDDTHGWYTLGRVYIDVGDRQKLLAAVERLGPCPQGGVFAILLLASWHLQQGELVPAGAFIEQVIGEAPQMPLPRLLRCEWLTRTGAPLEARLQACRDLLRVQPGHAETLRIMRNLEDAQRIASGAAGEWCTSVILGAGARDGFPRAS